MLLKFIPAKIVQHSNRKRAKAYTQHRAAQGFLTYSYLIPNMSYSSPYQNHNIGIFSFLAKNMCHQINQ